MAESIPRKILRREEPQFWRSIGRNAPVETKSAKVLVAMTHFQDDLSDVTYQLDYVLGQLRHRIAMIYVVHNRHALVSKGI